MTGILIVDKPQGMTSHTVVNKLRRIFEQKAIGHGGTLDPMATGVLPVFLGRATKAAPYVRDGDKTYLARFRFGVSTDTQDITGTTLRESADIPTQEALDAVLPRFRGAISQLPPMYSAVQVDGVRLYKLARSGVEIEREARDIVIHELEPVTVPEFGERGPGEWDFRVTCSKGTFIRTLCADIGDALGCGACLSALRRVHTGQFTIEDAYTLEKLEEIKGAGMLETTVKPCDCIFTDLPVISLTPENTLRFKRGAPVYLSGKKSGRYRIYSYEKEFLGLGNIEQTDRRPELTVEKGMFDE